MNNEKVTVVTVTYNAEDFLENTILSVINQNYKNVEYIIIDGGSTDDTVDIIKKYEDKISYWISEPDDGIYFAMNKAIEKATGKWINFMNAGDTFVDNTTVQQVIKKREKDADLIYGDHLNSKRKFFSVENKQNILRSMPCCHQSLYVKTNLMKENPFNTFYSIAADYDFMLKMYKEGKKIQYIKEPLCVYLEEGFSESNITQMYLEKITLYMNHGIDIDDIISSSAYKIIIKQSALFKKQLEKQKQLDKTIKDLISIRFSHHPIKKIKSYKKLISIYRKLK